ncbi:MAG TPA: tetratricopeptide repeat protein [Gemmatimonadaceae bacterium]|nr:tetratricopeptide repeat protein [Gemmatimonadaceae bacterium]
MMTKRSLLVVAALSLLAASPLLAQKNKEPKRPKLDAAADTNDWNAYYAYGLSKLDDRPDEAERAFYWASRLNPLVPDPLFAEWVAHWMNDRHMYDYLLGDERTATSKDAIRNDSLVYRATLKNPFVMRALERRMWDKLDEEIRVETGGRESLFRNAAANPWVAGWMAYTRGQMGAAVDKFREAAEKNPKELSYHLDLADALFHMGRADSAVAQLNYVIGEMKQRDLKRLVVWYNSKAQLEYRVGMVLMAAQRLDDAKAAFGRALAEDLSYYMAHARLGDIALAQHDTTAALNEYGAAAEINTDDATLRVGYGAALLAARRAAEAADQFRKAVEIDPYYAAARYNLAIALDADGKLVEAFKAYKDYLPYASRQDQRQVAFANERINQLTIVVKNGGSGQ